MLILILYSHCLHSKFEVLILLILNNTYDVVNFDSSWIDIYRKHKMGMIRIRTLQYSIKDCVCLCLPFSFFVNAATTKNVNVNEWFESLESFVSTISIFLNVWIWMSRHMNQTYFECYEFDINVALIVIATWTYKSM